MDTRAATTGSLIIVGITAVSGMFAHRRDGHVRVAQGVVFGAIGVAGAVVGTRLSLAVAPEVLLVGFSVLMHTVAVGLMTGFFGVGGGFLVVPALVLVVGYPMPVAVGTSLLIIAINSDTSLVARAGSGVDVDWAIVGPFTGPPCSAACSVPGSPLGPAPRPSALHSRC